MVQFDGQVNQRVQGNTKPPWLQQHDPLISWKHCEILQWSLTCFHECLELQQVTLASIFVESTASWAIDYVPVCYHKLKVFSKAYLLTIPTTVL